MASKPNLVPSKDALRALRSLALSPHAAVVGTLSGVCGLAAAHYHEHRKLALAEKILETKRTIHTISGGRGIDQVNRMFEAAERGEDYTLHHGRPMKPQKRRQSGMAVMRAYEELDSYPAMWETMAPRGTSAEAKSQHNVQQFDDISHQAYTDTPSHQSPNRSSPRQSSDTTSAIKMAKRPLTFRDFATQAMELRQHKQRHLIMKRLQKAASFTNTKPRREDRQDVTDLNPLPSLPNDDRIASELDSTSTLSSEESLFFNFVFGQQSSEELYSGNVFHTMHPWEQSKSETDVIVSVQSASNHAGQDAGSMSDLMDSGSTGLLSDPQYIKYGSSIPETTFSHIIESRYILREDNILQAEYNSEPRYLFVFNQIAQALHSFGKAAALLRLEQIFELYAETGEKRDFTMVKLLILEFAHHFDSKALAATVRRIVRKCLEGQVPKLYTVSLLYPHFGDAPKLSESLAYYYAMRYLEETCMLKPVFLEQKAELEKVIEGTLHCGIPLSEHLLLPVLRYQFSKGSMKEAQDLLDEMKESYGIETTFYTSSELIRGYASTGNWWKVKATLAELHSEEMSRQKVHGFAALFAGVLDEHMSKHSIEKSCAFVMQTIKEAGLVPVSAVTTRIVLGCIRAGRYDLLRQYINMVQKDYPFLEIGFGRASFASDLAATLKEMEATSEDIFQGCAAMGVNAIRDPFSNAFRGVVSEAVTRDLVVPIKALENHGSFKLPTSENRLDVHSFAEDIRLLIKHHHKMGLTATTRKLAETLVHKTRTVMRLDRLLSGSHIAWQDISESHTQTLAKKVKVDREQLLRIPPGLKALRLPPLAEVVTLLEKHYEDRLAKDLPTDHHVLQNLVTRLSQQTRHSDAYSLMEGIYHSKWVQAPSGSPFDIDLFTQWLRLAFRVRSGGKVKDVIWAVLEAGSELELTGDFVLLARIAIPKTLFGRHTRARGDDMDEGEYLNTRLRRRRAQESSKRDNRGVMFSTWKNMGGL